MADDNKTIKAKKIVDVAHPGDSAPSPNSKSVIISHHPTMTDPMVVVPPNAGNAAQPVSMSVEPASSPASLGRATHAVLQPLASSPQPTQDVTPQPVTPTVAPAVDEAIENEDDELDFEPAAAAGAVDTGSSKGGTDAVIGTKNIQSEADIATAEDVEAKRQDELQALVESKKYYLPINTIENQRSRQFIIGGVLLSLLLAAAWTDIALDAGLIHIAGVKALTHFFN